MATHSHAVAVLKPAILTMTPSLIPRAMTEMNQTFLHYGVLVSFLTLIPSRERNHIPKVGSPCLMYRLTVVEFRRGILSSLIRLNEAKSKPFDLRFHSRNASTDSHSLFTPTPQRSPFPSGASTPTVRESLLKHVPYLHHRRNGASALSSSSTLAQIPVRDFGDELTHRLEQHTKRPKAKRQSSAFTRAIKRLGKSGSASDSEQRLNLEKHIRDVVSRQKYLVTLCRALMTYGAPTHRLEDYLSMSARVLEIEAQFMYLPGCMIISFDDSETHTSGVKVIRCARQSVGLSLLQDIHEIYKDVVHDVIDVQEANKRLEEVMNRPPIRGRWLLVLYCGLASVTVGPFAFGAGWVDLGPLFVLGALVGLLQHVGAPLSSSYAHVFEVTAAFVTSLLARALGSIQYPGRPAGERLFCFSALAQSPVALILPGYMLLCASLELQSQTLIAGSVRLVYAIIYSLFLTFGITLGTVVYGVMDSNASSATTCAAGHSLSQEWQQFLFVPLFTISLILVNQGRWKQMPPMVGIAFAGYIVTHYTETKLVKGNTPLGTMMGALAIGLLANLYARLGLGGRFEDAWEKVKVMIHGKKGRSRSRWLNRGDPQKAEAGQAKSRRPPAKRDDSNTTDDTEYNDGTRSKGNPYGIAAVLMLPAIFVQVPSGLAISGSLVSGLASADSIVRNSTSSSSSSSSSSDGVGSAAFGVSYSIIQIAIGIAVGLSISAWLVWPGGKKKRRSGLFTL
jgi:uncharacterized membrane protein YjjP (DUF1212 family)